jgi:mRNA interferase MazF
MKHGEIWEVDFAPNIGQEIGKVRPAVIISHDSIGKLRLKVVLPITDPSATSQLWHVPLIPSADNGLSKACVVDCFQIKSISQERFKKKLGVLPQDQLEDVKVVLATVLGLLG